ncbi:MAG: hypothetical protein QXV32_03470 [Conexivisphaerales archaeon]
MVIIALGEWFRLPRLGTDGFKRVLAAGVEYESKSGFKVKENADLLTLKSVLASELGEEVSFFFKCFSCGQKTSCSDCAYNASCSIEYCRRCICNSCMKLGYENYVKAWRDYLAATG